MRTKKTFINIIIGIFTTLLNTFLAFFLNKIFLSSLGLDYLGLNGIFSNALGMLSLTELGIGMAISYELYVPLAQKDTKKISALMNMYKKAYYIIAIITFIIGLFVGFFVCLTAKTTEISLVERCIYFLLFLCNNCCTYLLAYKRTLLEADQKNYVISTITTVVTIIATIAKIIFLLLFKSYVLYIIITVLQTVIINIVVSKYIDTNYYYIKESSEKLDKNSYKRILSEIKSRVVIKLCNVLVSSTDNIIIGSVINVATAGLFQNYYLILSQLNMFINQISNSITPSLGNYAALESKEKLTNIVKELEFLNHCIGTFCFCCFCILISPFIRFWLGDYLLPFTIPLLLMSDLYITLIRDVHWKVNNMIIGFKANRRLYFHILRAVFNLVISIIGAYSIGVTGVVLGTLISSILIWISEVVYTYIFVLHSNLFEYIKRQLFYFMQIIIIFLFTNTIMSYIGVNNLLFFILQSILLAIFVLLLLLLVNIRNHNLYSIISRIKTILPLRR